MRKNVHLLTLFLSLSSLFIFCDKDIGTIEYDDIGNKSTMQAFAALSTTATPGNWMGSLEDSITLSAITIPGTHNSGAMHEPIKGIAKCQNMTIGEQLNAGVRLLDIRCRHIGNSFVIHHGSIYQQLNFDDVLNTCYLFLDAHPTETILMSVKEEYNSSNISRSFEETFTAYYQKNPIRWYLKNSIPTLKDARGKIVLIRRFGANSLPRGISATNWQDNTTFTSGMLRVQDYYNVADKNIKWNSISSLLDESKSGDNGTLYLNFTSGYKPLIFGLPNILSIAETINPKVEEFFKTCAAGHYGVIIMDFADVYRSTLIAKTNFDDTGAGVQFFMDIDYNGSSSKILSKGRYTLSQLNAKNVPNDWASSCKIPLGWKVTIYQNGNFDGKSWVLFPDADGGQRNFIRYSNLNDAMSSCVIE